MKPTADNATPDMRPIQLISGAICLLAGRRWSPVSWVAMPRSCSRCTSPVVKRANFCPRCGAPSRRGGREAVDPTKRRRRKFWVLAALVTAVWWGRSHSARPLVAGAQGVRPFTSPELAKLRGQFRFGKVNGYQPTLFADVHNDGDVTVHQLRVRVRTGLPAGVDQTYEMQGIVFPHTDGELHQATLFPPASGQAWQAEIVGAVRQPE